MKNLVFLFVILCFSGACSYYKTLESWTILTLKRPYEKTGSFYNPDYGYVEELTHKKSGARLVLVKNKDQARSFQIAFRTPPYDDTGLFHIFEHAVLAGSRLYPSKSSFRNVTSSTVAADINAYTSVVHTGYFFVTRDEKDFENLLSVEMDAVFFPNTVRVPEIIKREGWRYEVDPKTGELSFQGITNSEMKGRYANPDRRLWKNILNTFLPDTPYRYNSGGHPEKMSDLRFEQIVSAHKEYYHPQNSLTIIYGDLDFNKILNTIDRDFLSHFTKSEDFTPPAIPLQEDFSDFFKKPVVTKTYPGPEALDKDFVVQGYVLGELSLLEKNTLLAILSAFANVSTSPLQLRVVKEGLADSVSAQFMPGEDNVIVFVFRGASSAKLEKIKQVLAEEIDKVIEEGLDEKLLISTLNRWEFSQKSKKNAAHKGSSLNWIVVDNWLYPKNSLEEYLDVVGLLKKVRVLSRDSNFIKDSFKKYFKENDRVRWLVLKPDPQYSEKFNRLLAKKIEKALKEKPLSEYEKEDRKFREWVLAKESPEILEKTPLLKLSDIKVYEKPVPFTKTREGFYELIEYPQSSHGISYVKLYFDLRGVKEENIRNLQFFANLMQRTDTKNYSFKDLADEIGATIGSLSFIPQAHESFKNPEKFKPYMFVSLAFLNENQEKSLSLLKEMLVESQFTPLDRVQNTIDQIKLAIRNSVSSLTPGFIGPSVIKRFFPKRGSFQDEIKGASYNKYILKSEIKAQSLVPEFRSLLKNIFNQNRLKLVTLTADSRQLKSLKTSVAKFAKSLPAEGSKDQKWTFSNQKNYEAFATPLEVQYTNQTSSFKDEGLDYTGSLIVYGNYLTSRFLTPQLRERRGAYGGYSYFSLDGLWIMSSIGDPNLKTTFDVFSKSVDFMKKEKINPESLRPMILGALKPFYQDHSVSEKTGLMTLLYLKERTWEDYMKIKREILETSPEDFDRINQALARAIKKSQKMVSGNKAKIEKEASFAKEILTLP